MVAKTRGTAAMHLPSLHSPTKRSRGSKVAVKRKLFGGEVQDATCSADTDASDASAPSSSCPCGLPSTCPASSNPETSDMERQDSACSTLTALDLGRTEEAAGPPTPDQCRRRDSGAHAGPSSLHESLEAPIVYALQAWRQQLITLQPLVQLEDEVLLGALTLIRELAGARPDLAATLHASAPHLYTYLAAALWLCAKLCGVRTSIPNRSLMSQATRVDSQALSDFEMDLLFALDWNVAGLLARHNLLC